MENVRDTQSSLLDHRYGIPTPRGDGRDSPHGDAAPYGFGGWPFGCGEVRLARNVDKAEAILIVGLLLIWLLTLPLIATVASVEWTSIEGRLETQRAPILPSMRCSTAMRRRAF